MKQLELTFCSCKGMGTLADEDTGKLQESLVRGTRSRSCLSVVRFFVIYNPTNHLYLGAALG